MSKPRADKPAPQTEQTTMQVTTPRGSRWHVTQREGAFEIGGQEKSYTNSALAHAPPQSGRTQFRADVGHGVIPAGGENLAGACVEARAEALVDITAPPGLTPLQTNQRMEQTTFGDVHRGSSIRVATCKTCQLAAQEGSETLQQLQRPSEPDLSDKEAFPPLGK